MDIQAAGGVEVMSSAMAASVALGRTADCSGVAEQPQGPPAAAADMSWGC